ncbi:uncharacterized protein LTR77_003806 [Saxophila tyrrhenica]|uniref:Uncharacterized protein n=1 Tax=Saxophila tyrrhenica TaxID=1690608 RepID=A0AAV9PHB9_9PEZI|nr:hypothetical protein LTR77_003806 [Saxophila tyrrhenica]
MAAAALKGTMPSRDQPASALSPSGPAAADPLLKQVVVCGLAASKSKRGRGTYELVRILFDPAASSNLCSVELDKKLRNDRRSGRSSNIVVDLNGYVSTVQCRVAKIQYDLIIGTDWRQENGLTASRITRTLTVGGSTMLRYEAEGLRTPDNIWPLQVAFVLAPLHKRGKAGCTTALRDDAFALKIALLLAPLRIKTDRTSCRLWSSRAGIKQHAPKTGEKRPAGEPPSSSRAPQRARKAEGPMDKGKGKSVSGGAGEPGDDGSDDDDDDDENDPGKKKPPGNGPEKVKKKGRQGVQRPTAPVGDRGMGSTAPRTEADEEVAKLVSLLLQSTDPHLKNTRRIAKLMDGLTLRDTTTPMPPPATPSRTPQQSRAPAQPSHPTVAVPSALPYTSPAPSGQPLAAPTPTQPSSAGPTMAQQPFSDPAITQPSSAVVDSSAQVQFRAKVFNAQPVPGRNVQLAQVSHFKSSWMLEFADIGTTKVFFSESASQQGSAGQPMSHPQQGIASVGFTSSRHPIPFSVLSQNTPTTTVRDVAGRIATCFNNWPWELDYGKSDARKVVNLWISRALMEVVKRDSEAVECKLNAAGTAFSTDIHYVDKATGKLDSVTAIASIVGYETDQIEVPKPPSRQGTRQAVEQAGMQAPMNEREARKAQKAKDVLRWLAFNFSGMFGTRARVEELIRTYKSKLQVSQGQKELQRLIAKQQEAQRGDKASTKTSSGGSHRAKTAGSGITRRGTTKNPHKAGNSKLFNLGRWKGGGTVNAVRAPSAVLKTLGLKTLNLYIYSINAARVTPVLDTLMQFYHSGADVRRVWIEGARIADEVNLAISAGIPPSSQCDCDNTAAISEMHPCEGCAEETLCFKREFDWAGRLVCPACYDRSKTVATRRKMTDPRLVHCRVAESLLLSFRNECRTRGIDWASPESEAILTKATDDARSQLDKDSITEYVDQYTMLSHDMGAARAPIGNNPSRRRYVPDQLTVDAVFPEGDEENHGLKHSAGNVEITSVTCNQAKWIHLPGVLHVIGEYLRSSRDSTARKKLLKALMSLTQARLKHKYLRGDSERTRFRKCMAEMMRGETVPGVHGPWEAHSQTFTAHRAPALFDKDTDNNLWGEETYSRIQKCVSSTATFFGVEDKLFRLRDDTLWFGDQHSNPDRLDRNGLFTLFRERIARMRLECNRKWVTKDDEETLCNETMFQMCASMTEKPELQWLREKYGDRLGLPLTTFINSPLRFSIAHRLHGFQMTTGWPTSPSDVSERVDAENNILIESWYVNIAKMDMADEYYDMLDRILGATQIKTARYDPDHPFVDADEVRTYEGDEDVFARDDYVLPDFNDDVVEVREGEVNEEAADEEDGSDVEGEEEGEDVGDEEQWAVGNDAGMGNDFAQDVGGTTIPTSSHATSSLLPPPAVPAAPSPSSGTGADQRPAPKRISMSEYTARKTAAEEDGQAQAAQEHDSSRSSVAGLSAVGGDVEMQDTAYGAVPQDTVTGLQHGQPPQPPQRPAAPTTPATGSQHAQPQPMDEHDRWVAPGGYRPVSPVFGPQQLAFLTREAREMVQTTYPQQFVENEEVTLGLAKLIHVARSGDQYAWNAAYVELMETLGRR